MRDKLLNLIRLNPLMAVGDYKWNAIVELAEEQSIMGVALRGVQKLLSDKCPQRDLLLQWIGCYNAIEQQNEKVNAVLSKLVENLEECGIKPIVVKGQVVAQEYDEPLARQSGDIDVFIGKEDWNKVKRWIKDNRLDYSSHSAEKHIEIEYGGVTVELHHHLNVFSSEEANRYWQNEIENKVTQILQIDAEKVISENLQNQRDKNIRYVEINGIKVRTLEVTDTLVYLMVHAHHHLLTEGVGLRQLMDMCLFVHNHFDELDLSLLHRHVVGIGHEKAFNAYMALLNKYLGLPKEQIPFELDAQDYVYADKIMDEVWRGGNFGHKNNLKGVKPGLLHSLNTARLVISHSIRFYRLAPAESRAYWWHKIFWRMKRKHSQC